MLYFQDHSDLSDDILCGIAFLLGSIVLVAIIIQMGIYFAKPGGVAYVFGQSKNITTRCKEHIELMLFIGKILIKKSQK